MAFCRLKATAYLFFFLIEVLPAVRAVNSIPIQGVDLAELRKGAERLGSGVIPIADLPGSLTGSTTGLADNLAGVAITSVILSAFITFLVYIFNQNSFLAAAKVGADRHGKAGNDLLDVSQYHVVTNNELGDDLYQPQFPFSISRMGPGTAGKKTPINNIVSNSIAAGSGLVSQMAGEVQERVADGFDTISDIITNKNLTNCLHQLVCYMNQESKAGDVESRSGSGVFEGRKRNDKKRQEKRERKEKKRKNKEKKRKEKLKNAEKQKDDISNEDDDAANNNDDDDDVSIEDDIEEGDDYYMEDDIEASEDDELEREEEDCEAYECPGAGIGYRIISLIDRVERRLRTADRQAVSEE